jgi:hypothetical protein
MFRQKLLRLLLRAYPASWRSEYGEELQFVLQDSRLTIKTVMDVVISALVERVRCDRPWRIVGIVLFLVSIVCGSSNCVEPLSQTAYSHVMNVFNACVLFAGLLTTIRRPGSIRSATAAAVGAGLLGALPDITVGLLWLLGVVQPTVLRPNAAVNMPGHVLTLWFVRTDAVLLPVNFLYLLMLVVICQSAVLGAIGAYLGLFVRGVRTGYYRQE